MGEMVECYTQQGIRYFIREQDKTKDYVSGETLLVQGDSPAEVRKRARRVIRKAETMSSKNHYRWWRKIDTTWNTKLNNMFNTMLHLDGNVHNHPLEAHKPTEV